MQTEIFKDLRESLNNHKEEIIEKKKEITPNFNLVNLISPKELQLSRIIGEFLNPNGTHEQGSLFLDLFLNKFYKEIKVPKENVTVELELAQNVNGQIDIVIDFNNKFGIAIENKPFADDQNEQIVRYVEYLENKYSENYLMIYLSSLGQNPTERSLTQKEKERLGAKFSILSYKDINDWLLNSSKELKKAKRLKTLILEFVEYINLEFLKTNQLSKKMLGQALKDNILEAYEIKELWKSDKDEFDKIWSQTVNDLFNKTLPLLIFEELKKRQIIDENWEYIEGDFNIKKNSVKGFYIKKKKWKHLSYGILKNQIKNACWFFPAICSEFKSEKYQLESDLKTKWHKETNTKEVREQWDVRPTIWWSDFPNEEFMKWGYEQWSEIKKEGRTVKYLTDFMEQLIRISVNDLENIENEL